MDQPTDIIRNELTPTERLLWAGQPVQGFKLRPSDAAQIPFSILWTAFAFFWESMAIFNGAPLILKLWGIPFILLGLHMLLGRFFLDAAIRKHTFYGITPQRVIIITGKNTRHVQSLNIDSLDDITLTEKPDGSGTIHFGPSSIRALAAAAANSRNTKQYPLPLLELPQDARFVYELIRQANTALAPTPDSNEPHPPPLSPP